MGNIIMIEESSGDELNPYTLTAEQKKNESKNNTIYICKCCYPDKKLKYHFSVDARLVPCSPEYSRQHDKSCIKNVEYQKRIAYANPLQQDEDGHLNAIVYDNILKRPNRDRQEAGVEHNKKRDIEHTEQNKMRFSALIKKINLEVSYRQACRYTLREGDNNKLKIQLKLEPDFSKEVYGHAKGVHIANRHANVAGCNLDEDGVQFFYNRVTGIGIKKYNKNISKYENDEYSDITCEKLVNIKTANDKDKIKTYYSIKVGNCFFDITYDALRIAIQQYESTYNHTKIDFANTIIIGAGYQYANGDTYKDIIHKKGEIDRFTLLLVNKYGIFCESKFEVECFDVIMDYIMEHELYREIKFYKPYSFTKNAYGDALWLEDGVITVKGCKKVGIVEVFGMMDNEEYQEKTYLKNKYANENKDKFVFLTWKPQYESVEILKKKLVECISEIRKSAY